MDLQFNEYLVRDHAERRLHEADAERLASQARQARARDSKLGSRWTVFGALGVRTRRPGPASNLASSR